MYRDPPHIILVRNGDVKCKGERPIGTSKKRKQEKSLALLAEKSEIISEYKLEMDESSVKQMKNSRLDEIISEVKRKNNLDKGVVILESIIRNRLTRGTPFSNSVGRHTSPLREIKPTFVSTIMQISRIRQSLIPIQALKLIDGMIKGTAVQ